MADAGDPVAFRTRARGTRPQSAPRETRRGAHTTKGPSLQVRHTKRRRFTRKRAPAQAQATDDEEAIQLGNRTYSDDDYSIHKDDLVSTHEGKLASIHDGDVVDTTIVNQRPTSPAPSSSDSDVVIVGEVTTGAVPEGDRVMSGPPEKRGRLEDTDPNCRARARRQSAVPDTRNTPSGTKDEESDGLDDDEELRIVGEVGQVVTRDLPHPRSDCAEHRFRPGCCPSNFRHCDQCYCYVCDVKASECDFWGTGRRDRDHANAQPLPQWTRLRQAARAGDRALVRQEYEASGPLRMPPRQLQLAQQQPHLLTLGALLPLQPMPRFVPYRDPGTSNLAAPSASDVDSMLAALALIWASSQARSAPGSTWSGAVPALAGGAGPAVAQGVAGGRAAAVFVPPTTAAGYRRGSFAAPQPAGVQHTSQGGDLRVPQLGGQLGGQLAAGGVPQGAQPTLQQQQIPLYYNAVTGAGQSGPHAGGGCRLTLQHNPTSAATGAAPVAADGGGGCCLGPALAVGSQRTMATGQGQLTLQQQLEQMVKQQMLQQQQQQQHQAHVQQPVQQHPAQVPMFHLHPMAVPMPVLGPSPAVQPAVVPQLRGQVRLGRQAPVTGAPVAPGPGGGYKT